jgi:hypothetical protein
MPNFIFTFGFDHEDPQTGERLAHRYVEIFAPSEALARETMFARFGKKWSMEYLSKESAGVEKFNLQCHEVIRVEVLVTAREPDDDEDVRLLP